MGQHQHIHRLEQVVLVDDQNQIVGCMPKADVHHHETPLHRGFSIFLFNDQGEVLLQQRASSKLTWPSVWSNSCCGHEQPDECVEDAAARRIACELGSAADSIEVILPNYSYRAEFNGVVENEFCPVMVGKINGSIAPNPAEVADTVWVKWETLVERCTNQSCQLSPWCIEEVLLLDSSPEFHRWRKLRPRGSEQLQSDREAA